MTHEQAAQVAGRRPMKTRRTSWARWFARRIAATQITPNQISAAGLVIGLLAGLTFALVPEARPSAQPAMLIAGAALTALRLLCNMLDGMVAVEGGKASPSGPLWNELPDRLADMAILVGAGVAAGTTSLGWMAAALAVLTAYIRVLGEQLSDQADFSGPMAKPQRMALVIGAALVASLLDVFRTAALEAALILLIAGTSLTAGRRCWKLFSLMSRPPLEIAANRYRTDTPVNSPVASD